MHAGRCIPLLCLSLLTGCAGMQPYTPVNHREEGPPGGVFSGASGEFTLYSRGQGTVPEGQRQGPERRDMDSIRQQ